MKNDQPGDDEQIYPVKDGLNLFRVMSFSEILEASGTTLRTYQSWKIPPCSGKNEVLNKIDFSRVKMDNLWLKSLSDHFNYRSALFYN